MEGCKEGWLSKEGGALKSVKKKWVVLKDGCITYSSKEDDEEKTVVPLEPTSEVTEVKKSKKPSFEVKTSTKTFTLIAEDEPERASWMKAIQEGIEFRKKQKALKKISLDDFKLLKVIGKGSFGKVYQVCKKDTNKIYAMKVMTKKMIVKKNDTDHIKAERRILEKLTHPFLMQLHYSFQTEDKLYLVMDYINGGELFYHMQKTDRFDENRVRFYVAEIVLGLEFLHKNGVIYRDLKPENILITQAGHICLTDFGISKEGLEGESDKTSTFVGTPEYLAPEVLQGLEYGKAVDWWSLGTLTFELLDGNPPFYAEDVQAMYQKILKDPLKLPKHFTAEARDLVGRLLERNPELRLKNPDEVKAHPFFKSIAWEKLQNMEIDPPYKPPVKDSKSTDMISSEFTKEKPVEKAEADPNYAVHFDDFTYENKES